MQFRTELSPEPSPQKIEHTDPVFLIGSCFAKNMGEKLGYYKFHVTINPFGTLFDPLSIAKALERAISGKPFSAGDLLKYRDTFASPFHYHSFSGEHEQELLDTMNLSLKRSQVALEKAEWVVLSLGSALTYVWKQTGVQVANCHKIPQQQFEKRWIGIDEIVERFTHALTPLNKASKKIILTVSPVRYLKEGFVTNNRSKARLLEATHQLVESLKGVKYFPSYELLLDDLREYRYFSDDLLHPNHLAIQYIWEKFGAVYFSPKTLQLNEQVEQFKKMLAHRVQNKKSKEAQLFYKRIREKHKTLSTQHPYLDFSEELAYLPR